MLCSPPPLESGPTDIQTVGKTLKILVLRDMRHNDEIPLFIAPPLKITSILFCILVTTLIFFRINSSNNYANNTVPNNITETKKNSLLKQRFSQPSKDCRVGNWSEWSPCSKSCGIGEMQRYRKIIRHAKYGGRSCPPLKEAKWCALERDCISDYY